MQTVEQFLKERLLIDDNGNIFTPFDELVSFVKMYNKKIIDSTVTLCAENVRLFYTDLEQTQVDVDKDSILNCADIIKKQL